MMDWRKIPDELACDIEDFGPDKPLGFVLRTVVPDADDEGRPKDFGKVLVEGEVVCNDEEVVRALARAIATLPDLLKVAMESRAQLTGNATMTKYQLATKLCGIFEAIEGSSGSVIF